MQKENLAPAATNVAVLLTFFTRTETLRQTFGVIRRARPARLFLYQDGPRSADELSKIEAARQIVADEQIDWQCDVRRSYHYTNSGAWASTYDAQRWAFSLSDRCIVLEDDSTPALSFFRFCEELLERYADDQRIWMIAGFNHEELTASPFDYMFTTVFPIWGWASWRRVVSQWDEQYSVLDDPFNLHQLEAYVGHRPQGWKEMVKKMRRHRSAGRPIYETVFWSAITLNSGLTIVPTQNQIHNAAVSAESAHYQAELKTLPRRMQQLLTMPAHEQAFPLRHPHFVMEDVDYKKRVFRIMAWEHPWIKLCRSVEELFRNLRYGCFRNIGQAVKQRLRKISGHYDYL